MIAELRDALEGNDGQMLAPAAMVDAQFELYAGCDCALSGRGPAG